jgi:hypothetical protein
MWPKHLVPEDAHGGIESLPLVSASADAQPNPQQYDCGCVTILNITDADTRHGGLPFEMRLASSCGRRDCTVTVDPSAALDARRVAVERLLGHDVALNARDDRAEHLTALLDASIAQLRQIATAVAYDRSEVAEGDTITLADATATLLELRTDEAADVRAAVAGRDLTLAAIAKHAANPALWSGGDAHQAIATVSCMASGRECEPEGHRHSDEKPDAVVSEAAEEGPHIARLQAEIVRLESEKDAAIAELERYQAAEMFGDPQRAGLAAEADLLRSFIADVRLGIRSLDEYEAICGPLDV